MPTSAPIQILAIAAHRDDIELSCGGTLIKAAKLGQRTAILDLTEGEMGTRGSAALRGAEADRAAELLGVSARETLGLPDAGIENTPATREALARVIRRFAPRVVIAPALDGRHPDHRVTAQLVRDACFVAGLAKVAPEVPKHRPHKIVHTLTYRQDFVRPTFVVDISDEFEQKMSAVRCYASQFDGATQAGEVYPTGEPLYDVVTHYAATYGSLIRTRYGEPFFTTEMMRVDDLGALELLTLQRPRSPHPDELLFIVVHQASELWFKEILHELDLLTDAFTRHEVEFALFRMGRINALMRIVSAQLSALETLPPQHFAAFRQHLGSSSGSQSVQFRAIEAASGLREPHFMLVLQEHGPIPEIVQKALSRPPLQEQFLDLLRAQSIELEQLYVGERPTTLFFLAESLLEYEQQFGQWRFKHVQLVERVLGPLTGGTGGTLGAKYLARTIDQKFFPALWAVRARFYGTSS